MPPAIEDCRRQIELESTEIQILERESASGANHSVNLARLEAAKAAAQSQLKELEERWSSEKEIVRAHARVARPAGSRPPRAAPAMDAAERERLKTELQADQHEAPALQGERPLLQVSVDGQAVAQVIANWTGIPLGRMVSNEIQTVLNLKNLMEERIIGQPDALEAIAEAMRTSRARIDRSAQADRRISLVGTSGVGKTETALTLAELLYGGGQNMTRHQHVRVQGRAQGLDYWWALLRAMWVTAKGAC